MMRKVLFALSCLVAISFAGCDKPAGGEETGSGITVTGGTTIEVAADQTTATLSIEAEAAWTASIESGAEWLLEVTPASGEAGSHTLTLNFTVNETEAARTATVRLASGEGAVTVTLNQKGTNDEGGEQPAGDAIIKRMEIFGEEAVFTTDDQGRLTKIESVQEDGSLELDTEFIYADDRLTVVYFDGYDTSTTLYEMADGRLVRGLEYEDTPNLDTFTYNADGTLAEHKDYVHVVEVVDPDGTVLERDYCVTYTYTWTDGNVTRINLVLDDENGTTPLYDLYLTYGTQTSGIRNFDLASALLSGLVEYHNQFAASRLTGVPSRNLPVKIAVAYDGDEGTPDEYELRYEFAENGAVAKTFVVVGDSEELWFAMEY